MQLRTHLVVGLAVALYFLPHVNNKPAFFPTVLIATLLPNITSFFSYGGRNYYKSKGLFGFFRKENNPRGIIHTYTFCVAISILLAFFYPIFALPFFLGYSFHLYLDAFTPEGIVPFWPYRKKSAGRVKTGGRVDDAIFFIFCVFCVALLIKLFL